MTESHFDSPADGGEVRERLQRLATVLDSAVRVPGTRIRVGLDALIGLIPGIGDAAGLVLGLWVLWQGRQLQAPGRLQLRMLGNLALEAVLGSVPLLGDIFDVAWRANQRNVDLLMAWTDEQQAAAPEDEADRRWIWLAGGLGLALLVGGLLML